MFFLKIVFSSIRRPGLRVVAIALFYSFRRCLHLLTEPRVRGLCVHGGSKIDDEAQDVKGKDKSNDPLEHGRDVFVFGKVERGKGNGEHELDQDKREFGPEGDAEDAVLAVLWRTRSESWVTHSSVRGD